MKITYIAHSGFSVELEKHVLLFDYFTGELPVWDKQKTILVFVSHRHQDHFNMKIFGLREQYPHVHFFLGGDSKLSRSQMERKKADPDALTDAAFMKAHTQLVYGEGDAAAEVRTLKSTDEGVAFLVEAEGKTFYHAGDLNWWHWEGEALSWNRNMEVNYKREIDSISDIMPVGKQFPPEKPCGHGRPHFHVAFVPLDPRLEAAYGYGMDYFLQKTDAEHVFPMHMWEEYGYISKYKETETGRLYADRIMEINGRGDVFEL